MPMNVSMDWILIGTILIGSWAMLAVVSAERMDRAKRLAVAMANTAVQEAAAAKEREIPIAKATDVTPNSPPAPAASNRKR
jgi:hypothetical protein